jgi:hypothetical protein
VASTEGGNLVVFYYLSASEIWSIRGVASPEGGNLVVFYYLTASENCSDKRVAFGGNVLLREGLLYRVMFFSSDC